MSHSDIDISEFKSKLLDLLQVIVSFEQEQGKADSTVQLDQSRLGRLSRMDAIQVQAMADEALRRKQIYRQRIDAALIRIENGEFGLCCVCGEEIHPKRLSFDPTVLLCIDCADSQER